MTSDGRTQPGREPGVATALHLLEEAFEGRGLADSNESQSLLWNLATVTEAAWRATVPGATRTIESMVLHVAASKRMYADYAFGDATRQWGSPDVEGPWEPGAAPEGGARVAAGGARRADEPCGIPHR